MSEEKRGVDGDRGWAAGNGENPGVRVNGAEPRPQETSVGTLYVGQPVRVLHERRNGVVTDVNELSVRVLFECGFESWYLPTSVIPRTDKALAEQTSATATPARGPEEAGASDALDRTLDRIIVMGAPPLQVLQALVDFREALQAEQRVDYPRTDVLWGVKSRSDNRIWAFALEEDATSLLAQFTSPDGYKLVRISIDDAECSDSVKSGGE